MPNRIPSHEADASKLGQPLHFEFSGKTAPNRFLKAAMTERLSSWDPKDLPKRGVPSKNLINVYKRWGEGALGVILTGNIMIALDQLEAPGNPIIPPDAPFSGERFEAFKEMASVSKAHGSLIVGQVSHPGRQTERRLQPDPISASDIQLETEIMGMKFAKPHPATQKEIQQVIDAFVHAAEYLYKAGYDGIELHGAHGYLLAQFLSQTTNKRTDQYGGDLRDRSKIILDIAAAIRERLPPKSGFIVGIKINSVEFQEGGFTQEEARQLVSLLEGAEFDFVELSGGTYQAFGFEHKRESSRKREAFFLDFADSIVPGLKKTKTYVTGGFKTVGAMVKALETVDGCGLARPVSQEPRLCRDILEGKVTGAIDQKIDQGNFGLTNVAAGTQIRQLGKNQEPIDLSEQKNVDAFMQDMGVWGQKLQEDSADMNMYGYVDLNHFQAKPYGTVEA
jgi:2,4-dienoyl-CoA reductase-like NADH-dependent reductase (Old Yellow Enzyme family)